jgi:hypothetical protein
MIANQYCSCRRGGERMHYQRTTSRAMRHAPRTRSGIVFAIATTFVIAGSTSSHAAAPQAITEAAKSCGAIPNDQQRLKCFDDLQLRLFGPCDVGSAPYCRPGLLPRFADCHPLAICSRRSANFLASPIGPPSLAWEQLARELTLRCVSTTKSALRLCGRRQ